MLYQQSAFVLHRRPHGETSLLVTFFTPEFGRLQANIRGVRTSAKTSAQKQAWLQPFQPLHIQWQATSSYMEWIYPRSYEAQGAPYLLQARANLCGLYLNELLYRLLQPGLAMETLYQAYHSTLEQLCCADAQHQAWLLRLFEWDLLVELGYEWPLLETVFAEEVESNLYYRLDLESGWYRATDTDMGAVRGECLIKLSQRVFCAECAVALKRLMRALLQPHLGVKPLATRQLFIKKES